MSIEFEKAKDIAHHYIKSLISSGYCDPFELVFEENDAKEFDVGWIFFFCPRGILLGGSGSEMFGVTKAGKIIEESCDDHPLKTRINEVYEFREREAISRKKRGYF